MAVGLDCGTAFYIASRENSIKKERNAFLTLSGDHTSSVRMLKRRSVPYLKINNRIHIIGKNAFEYAQIFGQSELRRPMKSGLLNPIERDALPVLKSIMGGILGPPQVPKELCVYCVPSKPIDADSLVNYHEDVLSNIISSLGYTPQSIPEAVALGYEGLIDDDLTGIAISMGAGMCNIGIMYEGIIASAFSCSKGGDFIDEHVSMDIGLARAKVQNIKEADGMTLSGSKVRITGKGAEIVNQADLTNVQHAVKSYYGVLINYLLQNINKKFENDKNIPQFPKPVKIVVGGGTAMVEGFIDLFNEKLALIELPIAIKEVVLSDDPHNAVSKGCLSEALLDAEESEDTIEENPSEEEE